MPTSGTHAPHADHADHDDFGDLRATGCALTRRGMLARLTAWRGMRAEHAY